MFCVSCGHDNPRENRYCGMCGMPFPHRLLTVPEAQSTLTFTSVPLEIAPSRLPGVTTETPQPVPPESEPVEPPLAPVAAQSVVAEEPAEEVVEEATPIVQAELAGATPTQDGPADEPTALAEVAPPAPFAAQFAVAREAAPIVDAPQTAVAPPQQESPVVEPALVAEVAPFAIAPEVTPVEIPAPEPSPSLAEPAPALDDPHPVVTAIPELLIEPTPTPVERPDSPVSRPLPEIRKYATSHRETPPVRVVPETRRPAISQPAPGSQLIEPPPASAGMPTFQSVVEASGAPPISPFEPPVEKNADEERELQEYIASFRYHPPEESVDELTMRSEAPVLDAEAPVAPSHPSFDDDVPPPPEVGPHPTGEEYYPPKQPSADRSRYLDIADTHQAAESAKHPSTISSRSLLGVDDAPPSAAQPPHALVKPAPRHWLLWTSLAILVAIFGTLGFFEGRAQMDPTQPSPIAFIRKHYAELRQSVAKITASEPGTITNKNVAEAPASTQPKAAPPAAAQPTAPGPTYPATQSAATPDQQQPSPVAAPPPSSSTDNQPSATPSTVTQKPAPDTTVAETKPTSEPPPPVAKPKSKPEPGQQELANAMHASDPTAEAAWLWKATSRGNSVAPVRLADMYIKGRGVPHSCEQALVLLRAQAAKEDAAARNRLAALYANGTCVTRDRVKAYQLMSSALAVDPTSEWAEQNRKELWQEMTPEERILAQKYH